MASGSRSVIGLAGDAGLRKREAFYVADISEGRDDDLLIGPFFAAGLAQICLESQAVQTRGLVAADTELTVVKASGPQLTDLPLGRLNRNFARALWDPFRTVPHVVEWWKLEALDQTILWVAYEPGEPAGVALRGTTKWTSGKDPKQADLRRAIALVDPVAARVEKLDVVKAAAPRGLHDSGALQFRPEAPRRLEPGYLARVKIGGQSVVSPIVSWERVDYDAIAILTAAEAEAGIEPATRGLSQNVDVLDVETPGRLREREAAELVAPVSHSATGTLTKARGKRREDPAQEMLF